MKEINELILPDDLLYSTDHEWLGSEGDNSRIGISDYAQDQLGAIVYVELPEVGDHLEKGEEFGIVESTKAVAELYMPVSGEIVSVNHDLEDAPELVNQGTYGDGWIIEIELDDPGQLEVLMSKDEYTNMLKGM